MALQSSKPVQDQSVTIVRVVLHLSPDTCAPGLILGFHKKAMLSRKYTSVFSCDAGLIRCPIDPALEYYSPEILTRYC